MKKLFVVLICLSIALASCNKKEEPSPTPDPDPKPSPTPDPDPDPDPDPKPDPTPAGEKCKASDYTTVKIGTQTWMAENYRCSKYDTESEAYNASWLTNHTLPTSASMMYAPFYVNATDKSKWDNDSKTKYSVKLTDAQIDQLGYLYNWAAAVGAENGYTYGTKSFARQGICPNGWHVPTKEEYQTLYDYIYKAKSLKANQVGKYLKTTSGWYDNNNSEQYPQGLDTYNFAGLPAGYAETGGSVKYVGSTTSFWTTAPDDTEAREAYCYGLSYSNEYFYQYKGSDKDQAKSVRCLKNN